MAAPLAVTYVPPTAPLPAWLSYTVSPTATAVEPYTVASLLPNGVPTLVVGAATVTQEETAVLQLPITVDSVADLSGVVLGELYTTAGGTEPTVVRALGGTRAFTLGDSGTRALAGATTVPVVTSAARPSPVTAPVAPSAAASASNTAAAPSSAASRSPASPALSTGSAVPAATIVSRTTAASATGSTSPSPASLQAVRSSLSEALASATQASSVDPTSVASLQAALASASSALAASTAGSSSLSSLSSNPPSFSSAASMPSFSSLRSSTSSLPSNSAATSPPSSASGDPTVAAASPSRLNSLTPSQLAAAIAAPICFFFLVIVLLILFCCCVRRRRKRGEETAALVSYEDEEGGEGASVGGGGAGGVGGAEDEGLLAAGGATGTKRRPSRGFAGVGGSRRNKNLVWEWVAPRAPTPAGARDGGEGMGEERSRRRPSSRASGRSVLSRLTGGRLGAGAGGARSATPTTEEGAVPEMAEKEGRKGEEQRFSRLSAGAAAAGGALLSVQRTRSSGRRYSPVLGRDDGGEGELQDVDLTSPRLNEDGLGTFSPLPLDEDDRFDADAGLHFTSPLPTIEGTGGRLRLSRYCTPPDEAGFVPGPSSAQPSSSHQPYNDPFSPATGTDSTYDSPPLRTPPLGLAPPIPLLDSDLGRYGPVSPDFGSGGGDKRDTRLGYLSYNSAATGAAGLTPPATPKDAEGTIVLPAVSVSSPSTSSSVAVDAVPDLVRSRSRPVVSEMGWLSGRWTGFFRSGGSRGGSDEEERVGSPDEGSGDSSNGSRGSRRTVASSVMGISSLPSSELFVNDARWVGGSTRHRSSTPPFSRLDPVPSLPAPVAYDPPVSFFPRDTSDPSSVSRYDDSTSFVQPSPGATFVRTPSLRAFPDSPLMHSPAGVPTRWPGPRSSFPSLSHTKRQSEGGWSAVNRIAASFASVGSGMGELAAGLGIDGGSAEGDEEEARDGFVAAEAGPARGSYARKARMREVSSESATDPYHYALPTRPSPAPSSPPRRPSRDIRRSQLRSSKTAPLLSLPAAYQQQHQLISAPSIERLRQGRYRDPFEDEPFEAAREEGTPAAEQGEVVFDLGGGGAAGRSRTVPDIRMLPSVSG
ncbi:hypothetical protein JCM8097_001926 [Rhodosporidiobolus ruineniae]